MNRLAAITGDLFVRRFVVIAATVMGAAPAFAQQVPTDPASTHIFPAGGRRGTTVPVRVGGECLSPYTRFTLFGDGVTAESELIEKAAGNYEPSPRRKPQETPIYYSREWKSAITIVADAPLGQKLWRVSSARGGTSARPFLVGDLPEFLESESNSTPERAEQLTLPVTVNGQIAGERDLDYYRFVANENYVVTIDAAVARLGSTLEPVIELFDSAGRRQPVAEFRVGSDPVLAFRPPATGDYRLLISNLKESGGPQYVYRFTISTTPYVRYAFPPAGQVGATAVAEFFGSPGTHSWSETVTFPEGAPSLFPWKTSFGSIANLETTESPVIVEVEPNNQATDATPVAGSTIYGRLTAGDEDCYSISAHKDDALTIKCIPGVSGSGLLSFVTIAAANGTILGSANAAEQSPRPCRLEWKAPEEGTYVVRVRDIRQGQSGASDAPYRLTITPAQPDFTMTAATDIANVVPGARGDIELKIDREGGFASPIDLTVDGLPPGVRIDPTQIPGGQDVFRLAFVAEADAQPGDSLLKIHASATSGERKISHKITALHSGRDAENVSLGSPTTDHLQLTVRHKPVFRLYCNEAYQYAYRGTIYPYLMDVERLDGFDGPIEIEVADRQIKDLDGAEVIRSQIPAGTSQFMLPLYLPETMHINVQAHSNIYAQGYVVFQDKWGRRQSMTQISEMRCMIRPLPTVAKLRVVEKSVALRPGSHPCAFKFERTSNFGGEFRVELLSPSERISMTPVTIPAGETSAAAVIEVSAAADLAGIERLKFRGRGDLAGGAQIISEAELPVER